MKSRLILSLGILFTFVFVSFLCYAVDFGGYTIGSGLREQEQQRITVIIIVGVVLAVLLSIVWLRFNKKSKKGAVRVNSTAEIPNMKNGRLSFLFCFVFIGLMISVPLFPQYGPDYWDAYDMGQQLFYGLLQDANRIKYVIVNDTGNSIQEIYISSSNSDSWGGNQWASESFFETGYQIEAKSDDVGPYDIKMVDSKGNSYVKGNIRITTDLIITFTQRDKEKKGILERLGNAMDELFGY